MSKFLSFKKAYLIYAAVLAAIMMFCLIHVGSVLKEYESTQPENVAIEQVKEMQDAAEKGKLKSMIKGSEISEELLKKTSDMLLGAKDKFTSRLIKNEKGGEELTYTVMSGEKRLVDVTLKSKGNGETKLLLFPMSEWEIIMAAPSTYNYDMTLPGTMTVTMNGETVKGTDEDGDGKVDYSFSEHFNEPEVIIRDSLGGELKYDGITKLSITEYTVNIPSNYKLTSADGKITVPVESAVTEAIADYKYVSEYIQMPDRATYRLGLLGDTADFAITDNLGNNVDYTLDGHTVTIEGQASLTEIPAEVFTKEDVLAHARTWNLFMTADLGGALYGYGQVESFLLPDSYLMDVAYKWATGIDITFTSIHTLDTPPFSEESVSGYVKYSDDCFSVDIKLTKIMHLNTGLDVTDTMNSRFYYIQKDGVWYVADIQEIIG